MIAAGFVFVFVLLSHSAHASDWLEKFDSECRARGGEPVHNATGGGHCRPRAPGSGGAASNPFNAAVGSIVEEILKMDAENEGAARDQRLSVLQRLEQERHAALRRQDAALAAHIAAIEKRLRGITATDAGGMRLKLGAPGEGAPPATYGLPGRHVFRNDIFTGQDGKDISLSAGSASSSTNAQLTIKTGEAAIGSLQKERLQEGSLPAAAPPASDDTPGALPQTGTPGPCAGIVTDPNLVNLCGVGSQVVDPATLRQPSSTPSRSGGRAEKSGGESRSGVAPRIRQEAAELAIATLASEGTSAISKSSAEGILHRRAIVAHFGPQMLEQYEQDRGLASRVDALIQDRVEMARLWQSRADMAARDRGIKAIVALKEPDRNPGALGSPTQKHPHEIVSEFEATRRSNAESARELLRELLKVGFSTLTR